MPQYADIYTQRENRCVEEIFSFLEHFLPSYKEAADEYEVPQFSPNPNFTFSNATDLIDYCCEHHNVAHSIYWRSEVMPEHAMIFFTKAGAIIFGISTPADNPNRVDSICEEFSHFFRTEEIIVTNEDCPSELETDFRKLYASLPRIPEDISAKDARGEQAHRPFLANKTLHPIPSPPRREPFSQFKH